MRKKSLAVEKKGPRVYISPANGFINETLPAVFKKFTGVAPTLFKPRSTKVRSGDTLVHNARYPLKIDNLKGVRLILFGSQWTRKSLLRWNRMKVSGWLDLDDTHIDVEKISLIVMSGKLRLPPPRTPVFQQTLGKRVVKTKL